MSVIMKIKNFLEYKSLFSKVFPLAQKNFSTSDSKLVAQCLEGRSLVRLSGKDASVYLQGLITNDMKHLNEGSTSMFTMFLNSKGRVLYDSIIYNTKSENTYFVECDSAVADSLKSHLLHYKVRRKVDVTLVNDEFNIWAVADDQHLKNVKGAFNYKNLLTLLKLKLSDLIVAPDPRLSSLGLRIIAPKDLNVCTEITEKTDLMTLKEDYYKLLRYCLGIGEGIQELPSEKCFPMEINGDYLHGISFQKGCYIGQELTARTYHTGVIRKRLMPLNFESKIENCETGTPIYSDSQSNKSIGKLFGVEQTSGVGLLRIEEALKANVLTISNNKCTTYRPFWWPAG